MARRVQLAEDERLIEVLVAALKDLIGIRNHLSRQYKEAKTRAEEALDKAKKWGDGLPWE